MKQNKQEQIVEEKFLIGNKDCYACSEEGSHCGDRDCYIDIAKQLISTIEQQAEIRGAEEERERVFHEIWDELDKVYNREMLIHKPMRKEDENIILGESYNAFRQLNKVIKALSSKEDK